MAVRADYRVESIVAQSRRRRASFPSASRCVNNRLSSRKFIHAVIVSGEIMRMAETEAKSMGAIIANRALLFLRHRHMPMNRLNTCTVHYITLHTVLCTVYYMCAAGNCSSELPQMHLKMYASPSPGLKHMLQAHQRPRCKIDTCESKARSLNLLVQTPNVSSSASNTFVPNFHTCSTLSDRFPSPPSIASSTSRSASASAFKLPLTSCKPSISAGVAVTA